MRFPTQILLLGALLASGARAQETAPAASTAAEPAPPPPAPGAAVPASGETVQLDPVLVTADLWETPFERMPASVSVYDGALLERSGVRHFGDLADQVPNLTWTGATSRPRYFQIRGIGENSQYEGETPDSAVAFKVDDLDFTGLGGLGSTFDVRQVEVLRGPQAGAFGANAAGGIIQIVTNEPTPEHNGYVLGTLGTDNLREAGVAYGGTLTPGAPDKLMFRVAAQHSESDGFRRNRFLDRDTNARDEDLVRLKLAWNANELWRWDAGLLWSRQDNGFDEFALDNNGRFTYSDQPGRDEQDALAGSLRGTYQGRENLRFTTVTTATRADSLYSYDQDWVSDYTPADSYQSYVSLDRDRETYSQEFRLDGETEAWVRRWTLGVYFAGLQEASKFIDERPANYRHVNTDYRSANQALFGQVGGDLAERTRLTLGLRVEHVDVRGDGDRFRISKADGTVSNVAVLPRATFDDVLVGGKITLEHDFSERHMGFASVARGYKAGGVNVDPRIDPAAGDPRTYGTETLWNFEAGLRGKFLDDRLSGDVTVFHILRENTQVRDSGSVGVGAYRFFIDNGERSEVTGIESTASYALTERFTVFGSLGLMDSELDRFTLSNGNASGGRRLANTPRASYTAGLRYADRAGWFGRVELVGRTEVYDSNNQNEARSAFNVVNAGIGRDLGNWTLTLWTRNVFDEEYEKRVFFFENAAPDYIPTRYETRADPRTVGVSAMYRF
jgi:outer membrane receptor protein involved in Fe transport